MDIQSLRTDDCIDQVVDKYKDMVYRLALSHTGNRHDADDVFQDVFVRYISKPRTFDSEEHRKAWLIRVTINRSRSLFASWFRKAEPLDETLADERAETVDEMVEYLARLPRKYRSVLHLFYYEGYSTREIGELLDTKESTVRTWLTRARNLLRDRLKEGGFSHE